MLNEIYETKYQEALRLLETATSPKDYFEAISLLYYLHENGPSLKTDATEKLLEILNDPKFERFNYFNSCDIETINDNYNFSKSLIVLNEMIESESREKHLYSINCFTELIEFYTNRIKKDKERLKELVLKRLEAVIDTYGDGSEEAFDYVVYYNLQNDYESESSHIWMADFEDFKTMAYKMLDQNRISEAKNYLFHSLKIWNDVEALEIICCNLFKDKKRTTTDIKMLIVCLKELKRRYESQEINNKDKLIELENELLKAYDSLKGKE